MLFSIIIPVYKVENYLHRCIDSVFLQSYRDFEVILIDDGSTDCSSNICDEYVEKYSNIYVIHKSNAGLSSARNAGIKLARGTYILFLDSDDLWDYNNALKELRLTIVEEEYPDLICYGTDLYDEQDRLIKSRIPNPVTGTTDDRLRQLVKKNEYISTAYVKALNSLFLLSKDLFFYNGIFSEDIDWSGRILEQLNSVAVYPRAFCKRICRTEGSITANIGRKNLYDIFDSIERALDRIMLADEVITDKDICLEYWAYQYAMLLSLAHKLKHDTCFEEFVERMNSMKGLLKYGSHKKIKMVRILVRMLGIKRAILVLGYRWR